MTIAFAILSLTIVSTMVIGTTYAKFTSTISNAGTVNAAGFLITGTTVGQANNVMIAPSQSENVTMTIAYFSQVDTDITSAATMDNSANTGAFSTANWSSIKTFFNTNYAALNTYFGIESPNAATGAVTATNPSDLILVNTTGLLANFASAMQTASNTASAGLTITNNTTSLRISAMDYEASAPLTVSVTVPVTWQTDTTGKDTFDTLIGNCIAALLNPEDGVYGNVTVSGTTVTLNYGTGLNLVLTAAESTETAGTAVSTPSTISVNTGFTATQHIGSAG